MKDKIGTTDIKILVDRLDCGDKHGKDTDTMTKKVVDKQQSVS